MRNDFIILIGILFFFSCKNEKSKSDVHEKSWSSLKSQKLSCEDMPDYFDNFEEVNNYIDRLDWQYKDEINIQNSWIFSAEYHSCDGNTGYFNMCTKNKCYVHDYVEINVWEDFKDSDDAGKYYQKYMKGVYQMYDRVRNHD